LSHVLKRIARNIILVFVSALMTISAMKPDFCEQLCRLPVLIHHYQQHQAEEEGKLSFIAFLQMHYNEDSSHKDEEDHGDLPLFNHCCCYQVIIVPDAIQTPGSLALFSTDAGFQPLIEDYHFSPATTIFQPPRA
jgi:hypothetical protein